MKIYKLLSYRKSNHLSWLFFLVAAFIIIVPFSSHAAVMPDFDHLSPVTNQITGPVAVAIDFEGRLYVAEPDSGNIMVLSQSGRYISKLSGLDSPISVAVDTAGRIFVGSRNNGSVEVYDADFNLLFKLGSGDGEFILPNDICIDWTGRIYVVDKGNNVVRIYDSTGHSTSSFGSPGNADGQFNQPVSITIDEAAGEVIVLDRQLIPGTTREGSRVQFFDMSGVFLRSFTKNGTLVGDLFRPQDIAVDYASRLYVTDSRDNVVLVYDNAGVYLDAISDLASPFRVPLGITVDLNNRLYVASRMAKHVEVFGIDNYLDMTVDPVKLEFTAKEGNENPAAQSISIQNTGNLTFNWIATVNDGWLSLSDDNAVLESGQVASTDVAVDITGLTAGEYTGSIIVSAGPGAAEVVQVALTVEPSARLAVAPAALSFAAETGTAPNPGTFAVANAGDAPLHWSISIDQPWIVLDNFAGILADSGAEPVTVTVTADVTSLAAGTYSGTITVSGTDALDSPATIGVSLTLTEPPVVEPPTPADRIFGDMIWNLRETIPPVSLNGVWVGSGSQIYTVGQAGTILRFNGSEWSVMDSRTDRDLYGVWGCFDPEGNRVAVFAVGAGGTILHYDSDGSESTAWTVMESSGNDLTGVWGTSATDVYAVGLNGTILHYNGTNWTSMNSGTGKNLYGVWGSFDADTNKLDVYAVGQDGTIVSYDGTAWNVQAAAESNLNGIWGSSAADIYAVGKGGTILHSNGSDWSVVDSGTPSHLNSIWGSSKTDVYAVGSGGTILHFDGVGWTAMASPTDRDLHSVWGTWETSVFAVGQDLTLLYYDYSSWQLLMLISSTEDLYSVWGRSVSDVYAVGLLGSILHYDGNEWLDMRSPTTKDLYSVWGRSEGDVFAVGQGGVILRYSGTDWTAVSFTDYILYGVWGAPETDVFAVGENGTVLHYDGTAWGALKFKDKNHLYSVWGRSASDVYMVGREGTILHYNGNKISYMPSPTGNDLYSIWGCPDNGLFAVGQGGTFLQYVDSGWISLEANTSSNLFGVWCSSATDVFLVGQDDTFLYYDGNTVQPADFGTGGWLRGIWGSAVTTDIFAVGSGGAIIHGKNE